MIDNQSRYDSRTGLGYGQTKDRFQKSRTSNSSFPYSQSDKEKQEDIEDFEPTEETISAIYSKFLKKLSFDPGAHKSTDGFYFAAGNTKLSDCYFRTEKMLLEMETFSNSISPIPGLYSSMSTPSASPSLTTGNFKRTGTTRGFSSAPEDFIEDEKESKEEFYSLKDLVKIIRSKRGE